MIDILGQMGTAASAINSIGSLFGGDNNAAIGEQMNWQLAHQRTLRKTAYQDTVEDMKAAGINPMAAYGSGPNSAQGGGGTSAPQNKSLTRAQAAQATSAAMAQAASIENIREQTALTEAQKRKVEAEIPAVSTSAENVAQQTRNLQATLPKIEAEIDSLREGKNLAYNQSLTEAHKRSLLDAQTRLANIDKELRAEQISNTEALTRTQQVLTELRRLEIPGAKNIANYEETLNGASQYGKAAGTAASVLGGVANTVRKAIGK